jgi:hypothetical protein
MASKTLTAPLAIIKVNGLAVGKMKSIRFTETIRRGKVTGLGQLTPDELPALEWSGSLSCSFYNIDFKHILNSQSNPVAAAILRVCNTVDAFVNSMLLQENGVQIDLMRKINSAGSPDPNTGIYTPDLEIFASVKGAFITRESMDVSEGQISGKDADFDYTTPVIYPI